tara:strand:- start:53 stop:352 length:300 start_codon:yes stop_codon:yes gene_type:complete
MNTKDTETLLDALRQVHDTYLYLTDGVGTITDDAYLAVRAALGEDRTQDTQEQPGRNRELSEAQCHDVYDVPAVDRSKPDYTALTSTASTLLPNDPLDW